MARTGSTRERQSRSPCAEGRRWHTSLPHTADAGFSAGAPTLAGLFEEAAVALAEIAAEVTSGPEATAWEEVVLEGGDVAGLLYAWLNELIAVAEIHRGAVVETVVERLDETSSNGSPAWALRGRIGLRPFGEPAVGHLRQLKSATYHGLDVRQTDGCWAMRAYVDL
jgi:SHS2 domain-containing protein